MKKKKWQKTNKRMLRHLIFTVGHWISLNSTTFPVKVQKKKEKNTAQHLTKNTKIELKERYQVIKMYKTQWVRPLLAPSLLF